MNIQSARFIRPRCSSRFRRPRKAPIHITARFAPFRTTARFAPFRTTAQFAPFRTTIRFVVVVDDVCAMPAQRALTSKTHLSNNFRSYTVSTQLTSSSQGIPVVLRKTPPLPISSSNIRPLSLFSFRALFLFSADHFKFRAQGGIKFHCSC